MAKAGVTRTSLLALLLLFLLHFCVGSVTALRQKVGNQGQEASGGNDRYVVVFNTGTLHTDVHVFRFDENANLLKIDDKLEFFEQDSSFKSYAENPEGFANLVATLLKKAVSVVPTSLQPETPLILGAEDELLFLGEEMSEKILQVVHDLFKKSSLLYKPEWVTVLPAAKQGAYLWGTINYLLGNVGSDYSKTVAVLAQESASAQMTYALSAKAAANAPMFSKGEQYIAMHYLQETNYYLYSHGYFPYGVYALRAEVLKYTNDTYTYCVTNGYNGQFKYHGEAYNVISAPTGSNYEKCKANVIRALHLNATCRVKNCTFNGVWNGGGGAGVDKLYLARGFYDAGSDTNIAGKPSTELRLLDYQKAAKMVCEVKSFEEAHILLPVVDLVELPYSCLDFVFVYTMLVDGFGFDPKMMVTAVKEVEYAGSIMTVQWPLGAALELVSSNNTRKNDI
ncbi:hypothetical protein LUZ63_013071 [Rhynchospora breviuscula]|uniref:Apyrase n=1 Tax=Rhynchospora breviuscula TaxID=2022672 RepID=A0A9Q0HJU8_9POAL|nr:hypothetical protein LUZ63_013071 [Rhynchospora breviuscula]